MWFWAHKETECDRSVIQGEYRKGLVAEEGLEPPTRGLWFRCSNQLSYSAIWCATRFMCLLPPGLIWRNPKSGPSGWLHLERRFTGFVALRSSGYLAFREKSFTSDNCRPHALPQRLLATAFAWSCLHSSFVSFSPHQAFLFNITCMVFSLF